MESDLVVGEDGEFEKMVQLELDGVVDEISTEMEVDNGVSSENGKVDENQKRGLNGKKKDQIICLFNVRYFFKLY